MRKILFSILILQACNDTLLIKEHTNNPPDNIEFAIIGDYGEEGQPAADVSQLVKSWDPDFIITLGDNNYERGEIETLQKNISQYYCDYIYNPDAPDSLKCSGLASQEKINRFFPSIGNHDYHPTLYSAPYRSYFTLPCNELFYDFISGPVHFYSLNSAQAVVDSSKRGEQYDWLKNKLTADTSIYQVVYFHHAPYSSAKHGNIEAMQWPYQSWGVDLVISGHDHVYEKISYKGNDDFYYLVNGLGGRDNFYQCDSIPLDASLFNHFCFENQFGAMKAIVNEDSMRISFHTIDNPFVEVDHVTIIK